MKTIKEIERTPSGKRKDILEEKYNIDHSQLSKWKKKYGNQVSKKKGSRAVESSKRKRRKGGGRKAIFDQVSHGIIKKRVIDLRDPAVAVPVSVADLEMFCREEFTRVHPNDSLPTFGPQFLRNMLKMSSFY